MIDIDIIIREICFHCTDIIHIDVLWGKLWHCGNLCRNTAHLHNFSLTEHSVLDVGVDKLQQKFLKNNEIFYYSQYHFHTNIVKMYRTKGRDRTKFSPLPLGNLIELFWWQNAQYDHLRKRCMSRWKKRFSAELHEKRRQCRNHQRNRKLCYQCH